MSEITSLYYALRIELEQKTIELDKITAELDEIGREQKSIVVKTINDNQYYYEQWRENGKLRYKSLGKVTPGGACDNEIRIMRRKELLSREEELQFLISHLQAELNKLKNWKDKESILSEYSFEVFWKDQLSARVSVGKSRVHVSRYIKHPIRQIFSDEFITRNQLNEVLKLRCFEEGRADCTAKLKALGLSEYNPLEIVKKTHGVSFNDYIWIRFPGERLTAKDVLVRD